MIHSEYILLLPPEGEPGQFHDNLPASATCKCLHRFVEDLNSLPHHLSMAELVVGVLSLGIQTCQGLASYYSAWKSYDEQINQTHRDIDALKLICENLHHELQGAVQIQEPIVRLVVGLIAICQDGIESLRTILHQCQRAPLPHGLAARFERYRARTSYPLKRKTIQELKDTVHNVRDSLTFALQLLVLYAYGLHNHTFGIETSPQTTTRVINRVLVGNTRISPRESNGNT